jgi:hypothetical protein
VQNGDAQAIQRYQFLQGLTNERDQVHWPRFAEINRTATNYRIENQRRQEKQADEQYAQHNRVAISWLEKNHPAWATGDNLKRIRRESTAILRERGYSDAQISKLRPTAAEQSILAEVAMWRLAPRLAKEAKIAGLPTVAEGNAARGYRVHTHGANDTVQKPGVGRSSGYDVDDEKKLLGAISSAKGERAQIMAAAKWQKAKYGKGR